MTKRYIGGILSANMPAPSYLSASGIWNTNLVAGYIAGAKWPGSLPLIEILVIAGGGSGGGGNNGGGGGAGGLLYNSSFPATPGTP